MYIDFPVAIQAPGILDSWLSGQSTPQRFADPSSQVIDLAGFLLIFLYLLQVVDYHWQFLMVLLHLLLLQVYMHRLLRLQPLLTPFFASYAGPSGGSGILSSL